MFVPVASCLKWTDRVKMQKKKNSFHDAYINSSNKKTSQDHFLKM